jgi:hypothetical protein
MNFKRAQAVVRQDVRVLERGNTLQRFRRHPGVRALVREDLVLRLETQVQPRAGRVEVQVPRPEPESVTNRDGGLFSERALVILDDGDRTRMLLLSLVCPPALIGRVADAKQIRPSGVMPT